MIDRRTLEDPCAHVDDLARAMPNGLWLNLLVKDLDLAIGFQTEILGCETLYRDTSFALMRHAGSTWMIHVDATYASHPMGALTREASSRGAGCEIRVQGCDPDAAQERAQEHGFAVIDVAKDKPHGLREAYLMDADGYVWVPSIPLEQVCADVPGTQD